MKLLTIILLSVCGYAAGYLIKVQTTPTKPQIAPLGWVHIQKLMLPLFENVCEESSNPIVKRLSEEFSFDTTGYLKEDVISNLQNLKSGKGLLAKGEIFTEANIDHINELRAIYEVLYYAKDFDTFYKAASWARQNVNCGVLVDAIYLALITRKDIEKVSVPAPYELLPNYFIRKDFIIKASALVSGQDVSLMDCVREDGNAYIIDANYTSNDYEDTEETRLAYFHEDIGLNSYFFLTKLKYLPWLDTEFQRNPRYGEYIFHFMKQLMTKYNLERYSNDLYEIDGINWDEAVDVSSYDPMLIYSNGKDFCDRTSNTVRNSDMISSLKNIEHNIGITVTHMRDGGFSKQAILNQIVQILVTNNNSYLNLAMQAISQDASINSTLSSLAHYMTEIRDPIFWSINKKMVDIITNALRVLPGYEKSQLYFPGVQVTNVEVKKMITSFDKFDFDITDAMKVGDKDPNFQIKISQTRLNHKPFAIKVNVSSLVIQKGLVKIYLGPKFMPGDVVDNRKLFMLIDKFEVNLKKGNNIITRTSDEITNISDDFVPLSTIRKGIVDSEFGVDALTFKTVNSQIGFPSRLILPRGSTSGLPFQMFVFVAPYVKAVPGGAKTNLQLNYDAILSPGYPLDLDIEIQELFNLPNALVKDIIITNKIDSKPSTYGRGGGEYGGVNEKQWPTVDDVEPEILMAPLALVASPEFTKSKEPFDYKARKGQYGKKNEFQAKQDEEKKPKEDNAVDFKKEIEINKIFNTRDDKMNYHDYAIMPKFDDVQDVAKDLYENKDRTKESTFNKEITITNKDHEMSEDVSPIRLLSSSKKHYPSIFNIILNPPQDQYDISVEKVYE